MAIPSYCIIVEEKKRSWRADIHGYTQLLYYCWRGGGGEGPIYMAIPSYCVIAGEKERRGRRRADIHGYTQLCATERRKTKLSDTMNRQLLYQGTQRPTAKSFVILHFIRADIHGYTQLYVTKGWKNQVQ